MNRIKINQIAVLFAGCFLGAGFVSGQEIYQFFVSFGILGFSGLLLALTVLCFFGILILRVSQMSGIRDMDAIILYKDIPMFRAFSGILQSLFLFSVVVIMISAGGALIFQLTGIPNWITNFLICMILSFMAFFGLYGIVSALSVCIPLIISATVIFSMIIIFKTDFNVLQKNIILSSNQNPFLPNWFIAAITFASYNLFSSIGILTPFGNLIRSKKEVFCGVILGTVYIAIIAICIFVSILLNPEVSSFELPMLSLVSKITPVFGYLYGALLLIGITVSALSSLTAFTNFLSVKLEFVRKNYKCSVIFVSLAAFIGSLFGFGTLVSTIYPIFGYLCVIFMASLVMHFLSLTKTCSATSKNS